MGERVLLRAGGAPRQSSSANADTLAAPGSPSGQSSTAKPSAFENGAIVAGKYLVEETIAEGGIGIVVVARHLALQQRVAIKHLKPKTLSNPTLVERFVREARLAAQLTSEHVVRVYDVGTLPEAGPYMVMEYLVGEDLGQTVQAGPIAIHRAVDYVLQACDALAEAHALRIVHRDIKPENMFLAQRASSTPVLKIIDFGISKVATKRGDENHWGTETGASERFGTPLYMSPEQLRSTSSVDARTDLWSLGVVLHELLTGELPFPGSDLPQICTSVLTAPATPLRSVRPDAPPELEAAILRCLEKDAQRRFRNVAELAQEIAPFGPTSAADRTTRIADVVRRAGDSIRPPTPAPGALRLPGPLASEPDAALRAVTTVHTRAPPHPTRVAAVAALAGMLCAGSIMFAAVHFWPTGAAGAPRISEGVAATRAAPPPYPETVSPSSEPSQASEELPIRAQPSAAIAATSVAAPSNASVRMHATSSSTSAARPHIPPTASPPRASSAAGTRRAQFGDRE